MDTKVAESRDNKIDVGLIMDGIKSRARERSLEEDLKVLKELDIKNIEIGEDDVFAMKKLDVRGESNEGFSENLAYLNRSYSIADKYNFVGTHRKGPWGYFIGKMLSKLFLAIKIFIDQIVVAQESFNANVVRVFNSISKKLEDGQAKSDDLASRLEEQASRSDSFAIQITDAHQKIQEQHKFLHQNLDFDYKVFEDAFRGDQATISQRQSQYLNFFHECKNVVDIGCGRGEFIQLLHDNGTRAFGLDIDSNMAKECKNKGLNVLEIDAVSYFKSQLLKDVPDKIDGVFSAQVIEHLHMDYLIEMLKLSYQLLVPEKFIVLESINIKTLSTFAASVYLDPSHVKPIHPDTLKFLMEYIGFKNVRFIFSAEFPDNEKLQRVEATSQNDRTYNANIDRLNEVLFGPQDYAIVAQR